MKALNLIFLLFSLATATVIYQPFRGSKNLDIIHKIGKIAIKQSETRDQLNISNHFKEWKNGDYTFEGLCEDKDNLCLKLKVHLLDIPSFAKIDTKIDRVCINPYHSDQEYRDSDPECFFNEQCDSYQKCNTKTSMCEDIFTTFETGDIFKLISNEEGHGLFHIKTGRTFSIRKCELEKDVERLRFKRFEIEEKK